MLSQHSDHQASLKLVGYRHFAQTQLDYHGKIATIESLDILQRHVWLSSGEKLTFDEAAALHEYQEITYS